MSIKRIEDIAIAHHGGVIPDSWRPEFDQAGHDAEPETVSRWEQAKRPIDRSTYALIRQLVFDRLHGTSSTADWLRSLHKPKRLPRNVTLHLDAA